VDSGGGKLIRALRGKYFGTGLFTTGSEGSRSPLWAHPWDSGGQVAHYLIGESVDVVEQDRSGRWLDAIRPDEEHIPSLDARPAAYGASRAEAGVVAAVARLGDYTTLVEDP